MVMKLLALFFWKFLSLSTNTLSIISPAFHPSSKIILVFLTFFLCIFNHYVSKRVAFASLIYQKSNLKLHCYFMMFSKGSPIHFQNFIAINPFFHSLNRNMVNFWRFQLQHSHNNWDSCFKKRLYFAIAQKAYFSVVVIKPISQFRL